MKKLFLIGGGGHCRSCIDVIEQTARFEIAGIFDQKIAVGTKVQGYSVLGSDTNLQKYIKPENYFLITIGQIQSSDSRVRLFQELSGLGAQFATVISPRAYVSKHAKIRPGTIVMHDVLINANVEIGHNCILNTKALIEHDAKIADHCHISTASVVNGGCEIGQRSFVGSNSVLKEYIKIPENTIIQAGGFYRG